MWCHAILLMFNHVTSPINRDLIFNTIRTSSLIWTIASMNADTQTEPLWYAQVKSQVSRPIMVRDQKHTSVLMYSDCYFCTILTKICTLTNLSNDSKHESSQNSIQWESPDTCRWTDTHDEAVTCHRLRHLKQAIQNTTVITCWLVRSVTEENCALVGSQTKGLILYCATETPYGLHCHYIQAHVMATPLPHVLHL